jgi:hypothetical protein
MRSSTSVATSDWKAAVRAVIQESRWSPGTISLRLSLLASLLHAIVSEYVRATSARRLIIVNGQGGNRGIPEAALYENQANHGLRSTVVLHPSSLSTVHVEPELPQVHAGTRETNVMLALLCPNHGIGVTGPVVTYETDPAPWQAGHAEFCQRHEHWGQPILLAAGLAGWAGSRKEHEIDQACRVGPHCFDNEYAGPRVQHHTGFLPNLTPGAGK